jgi:hypothetical protein
VTPADSLGIFGSLAHSFWGWIPLATFAVLALFTGFSTVSWHRRWADLLWVPFLIFLRHTLYGIGMLIGFFTPPYKPADTPIFLYEAIHTSKGWKLKRC